mgnify:FL=1
MFRGLKTKPGSGSYLNRVCRNESFDCQGCEVMVQTGSQIVSFLTNYRGLVRD